jgi:hypothetical protein
MPSVLAQEDWQARRTAHERRVRAWTDSHKDRGARGEKHPVYDFLFNYYSYRPGLLQRWHPGPDFVLGGPQAAEFLRWPEYRMTDHGVALDPTTTPANRLVFAEWLRELLETMQGRPAFLGCFGLHEWAMVYQQTAGDIRHNAYALRFQPGEIAQIVEANGVCCTHFDAFRFFTAPARPLNRHQPTRATTLDLEQPGCLHANMDLYKWAFKLAPFAPSELVADCFALAHDIREVDMRASPYDLETLGFPPIKVETAAGRADYERHQRTFAARGKPLRGQLIEVCDWLLARELTQKNRL